MQHQSEMAAFFFTWCLCVCEKLARNTCHQKKRVPKQAPHCIHVISALKYMFRMEYINLNQLAL